MGDAKVKVLESLTVAIPLSLNFTSAVLAQISEVEEILRRLGKSTNMPKGYPPHNLYACITAAEAGEIKLLAYQAIPAGMTLL